MRIHFIAIGGSVMHQLAIMLKKQGHIVTGSDDDIFEPAKSRLKKESLLPQILGSKTKNITKDLNLVIIGMHAKADNPELLEAQKLNIPISSYPEYIYKQVINKQRIVVAGSYGKTTITAMIIHLLDYIGKKASYLIGGQLLNNQENIKIEPDSCVFITEGDEYPTSPLDSKPKFLNYHPHIALITGIDWDHINVYPNEETYQNTFEDLMANMPKMGEVIYNQDDKSLKKLTKKIQPPDTTFTPFIKLKYKVENEKTWVFSPSTKKKYPLHIFGNHNIQNLGFVLALCTPLGIQEKDFFEAMKTFKGVKKRMELIYNEKNTSIFSDFAHTPTKLRSAIMGLKNQFPHKKQVVCYELHSYSNLNAKFLLKYQESEKTDNFIIYYNLSNLKRKRLPSLSNDFIKKAFKNEKLKVFTDINRLKEYLLKLDLKNTNLAFISSGNFDNLNFDTIIKTLRLLTQGI